MLLERNSHLHYLHELVAKVKLGKGLVALVSGEAGIGKTSLLNTFRRETLQKSEQDINLACGGSDPLFTPRSFGPLHDMAPVFNDEIRKLLRESNDSIRLFNEILKFIKNQSKTCIFIFEDSHWADHATLDFLKFLSRRLSFLNALIIISYRNDEINNSHPFNDLLASLPAKEVHRLELLPLSSSAIKLLLDESNIEINKSETEIFEVTGGNPFFITELIASDYSDSDNVPASIRSAVSSRINQLELDEQNFLQTISLIPQAVSIELLNILFPERAGDMAMTCVERGLLTLLDVDSFRFRHELSRLGTLERVPTFDRKNKHTIILNALLELESEVEIEHLVHHAVGALNAEKVLEYAPLAANKASAAGAHREATAHLRSAIQFIDSASPTQAATLYESWAEEAGLTLGVQAKIIEARCKAISLWRQLGNKPKIAHNLQRLSRLYRDDGQSQASVRVLDEAINILESISPSSDRAMAYSLRSQYFMLNDQMDEAIEWGQKALELEEQFHDDEVKVHALNNIGTAKAFRGSSLGIDSLNKSLELALKNNLHISAARAYNNLSEALIKCRNFEKADKVIADGLAYLNKHDLESWIYYLTGRFSELRFLQGEMSEARIITSSVLDMNHLTMLMKLPAFLIDSRISSLFNENNGKEKLSQALESAKATNEPQHIIPARLSIIEYAWLKGDESLANQQFNELYNLEAKLADDWTVGEIVIWHKRQSMPGAYPHQVTLPKPYRLEMEGRYAEAADEWEVLSMPYYAALTLAQVSDPKQYQLLNRALKLSEKMGLNALIEKIKVQAVQLGVLDKLTKIKRGPYRSAKSHPMGLTKKEQEVFRLMVNGLSNRAIAEKLNRSQRTIEHHVSSILKKMKVESRMDAMLRIQNEPWLVT